MSVQWIGFWTGCLLGCIAGVALMALCVIAKRSDRDMERMFSDVVPPEKPRNVLPPHLPRFCDYSNQGRTCRTCEGQPT